MPENSPEKFYPRDQAATLRELAEIAPEEKKKQRGSPVILRESPEAQKIRERLEKIHKN